MQNNLGTRRSCIMMPITADPHIVGTNAHDKYGNMVIGNVYPSITD